MSKSLKPAVTKKKKKKSHNKNVPCKTFVHTEKNCICCGQKMQRISGDERYLTLTTGRIKAYVEIYNCINKSCDLYAQRIKPAEFNNLIFPGLSYGIDIIAEMGLLRFQEHKTIKEVYNCITGKYDHIEITQRHLQNVVNKIMYVMESSALDPKIMKERLLKKNRNIKGLVFSADGLEPEKGNEILYVVRETQTGEVLYSKFLEFSDTETIKKEIYQPLKKLAKAMNLPVLGLIADKQKALTTAFEEVFPGVPIQHCQSHFLKAMRKPIQEKSQKMAKEIKKNSKSETLKELLKKKKIIQKKKC